MALLRSNWIRVRVYMEDFGTWISAYLPKTYTRDSDQEYTGPTVNDLRAHIIQQFEDQLAQSLPRPGTGGPIRVCQLRLRAAPGSLWTTPTLPGLVMIRGLVYAPLHPSSWSPAFRRDQPGWGFGEPLGSG